jgi:hypothetical protein
LRQNAVSQLDPEVFGLLTKLEELDLYDNKVKTVGDALNHLENLTYVLIFSWGCCVADGDVGQRTGLVVQPSTDGSRNARASQVSEDLVPRTEPDIKHNRSRFGGYSDQSRTWWQQNSGKRVLVSRGVSISQRRF